MTIEIFYPPHGRLDSWLSVETDGTIIYSSVGPDYNINETISTEDAIAKWPLYAVDIREAVALAKGERIE